MSALEGAEWPAFRVTILGSGTSTGVPVITCDCEVCSSNEPKNKRQRASILLTLADGRNIVIDTGPDFRNQMIANKVTQLDQVLYTHPHADHCHGFDDLRAYYFRTRKSLPAQIPAHFVTEFRQRFSYAFDPTGYPGTTPQVDLEGFAEGMIDVLGLPVETVFLPHGPMQTAAFRFGSFVYATDFKTIPEKVRDRWRGQIRTMVASGIRFHPHDTHSTIPETLALFDDLGVERAVVSHLAHEVEYLRDSKDLPSGRTLAFDGMTIDVPASAPL